MTMHSMISRVRAFFRGLSFRGLTRLFGAPKLVVVGAEPAVTHKPVIRSAKQRRRVELRTLLGRVDGGGKHYGSKRALRNLGGAGKQSSR